MQARKFFVVITVMVVAGGSWIAWRRSQIPAVVQHVFINETADSQFDESIQSSILAAYMRTKVQNAVIISDRFTPDKMNAEAAQLFKELHLGEASQGRAILYLFSPLNHFLKIEVGYGLEGVLPDAQVHFLEQAAKSFTYSDRYQDFWAELINTLNIQIWEKEHSAETSPTETLDPAKFKFLSGGAGISSADYTSTPQDLREKINKIPAQNLPLFQPAHTPEETLQRYLTSLEQGLGEDTLPLLNFESRLFRATTPRTSYQLFRNARMYSKAGLDRLIVDQPLAFAFFKPHHPVLPIVLIQESGKWLVQEPLSWSLFQRFEDSMDVFLKFPLDVKSEELRHYLAKYFRKPLYSQIPISRSALVETRSKETLNYFYFQIYWLDRVAEDLKKQGDISSRPQMLWIAVDVNNNLGRFSEMLKSLEQLRELFPKDQELAANYEFYKKTFKFSSSDWRRSF